jgi:cytochrome c1
MMTIRCFKCGWGWSMNAAEVGAVLDQMHAEQHAKYYMAECPNCRRANKVSLKQLRRYAPRDWSPPSAEEQPAAEKEVKAENEAAPKEKKEAASKAKSTTKSTAKKSSTSKSKSKAGK